MTYWFYRELRKLKQHKICIRMYFFLQHLPLDISVIEISSQLLPIGTNHNAYSKHSAPKHHHQGNPF